MLDSLKWPTTIATPMVDEGPDQECTLSVVEDKGDISFDTVEGATNHCLRSALRVNSGTSGHVMIKTPATIPPSTTYMSIPVHHFPSATPRLTSSNTCAGFDQS